MDELSRDDLLLVIAEQMKRIEYLEAELARVRGGGSSRPSPPSFVKANRRARPPSSGPRKKRSDGSSRRRSAPTRVEEHYPAKCSCCGRKLSGGWVHTRREVIDIPLVPVEVVEHRIMARHCGVCGRREVARADLSGVVLGQSRIGIRLMSYISYLDTVCRLPIRGIQRLLAGTHGLSLSQGEIVRVLHTVAATGRPAYDALLGQVRSSAVVHADETGSREDGINGYMWSLSTPEIRFYHRDASRGSKVIQQLLGYAPTGRSLKAAIAARQADPTQGRHAFRGALVSDFYAAYDWYIRARQCCLTHLDRDLDQLAEEHADNPAVTTWVGAVLDLIGRAKTYAHEHALEDRRTRYRQEQAFIREIAALARPYLQTGLPQQTLARRIHRYRGRLFVFVSEPAVPPDNNAAERAIRPYVMIRKVSGGTRSAAGSLTQSVLLSLFGTWHLRGIDPLTACQQLLAAQPSPQPT
jgi:hypothetical protein